MTLQHWDGAQGLVVTISKDSTTDLNRQPHTPLSKDQVISVSDEGRIRAPALVILPFREMVYTNWFQGCFKNPYR